MTSTYSGPLVRRAPSAESLPSPRHAHAGELMRRLGEPLIGGNRVALLEDGPATFEAMYRAIESARDHVNLESYIVAADGPGEEIARRLADRCAAGVRINLLFDGFGSLTTCSAFFDRLRRSGVSLCEYNPLYPWRAIQALHRRDHRKLMVVDGRIGFIGGVNISPVYRSGSAPASGSDAPPGWRDLHVQVEGPVVQRLQRLFIAHWQRHSRTPMQQARYFRPLAPVGTHRVGVAASDAGTRRDPYHSALLGAIETARERVLLTTAYLVPPRRLLRRLVEAAERGVRVELLLPGLSDSWAALHAGRAQYGALLRAGVHIHERHDTHLHAKACVIDGVWASIGSSNIDWRSLLHNAEANIVVLDEDFASQVEQVFRADVALARQVELDSWERRSAWHRLRESIAQRFEFFL